MQAVQEQKSFGGTQGVYEHASKETGTNMRFAMYRPHGANTQTPVLWYLSGLTCTEDNVTVKGGFQQHCAEHGVAFIAPDTSPRGANIDGENESYDFGTGAGFYVDATESPWSKNYRMYSYITQELPELIFSSFDLNRDSQGITGHSMGGHGALTIGLKHADVYKSVSAFSPICAPTQCPWGNKALTGYLGSDKASWSDYDTVELIKSGKKTSHILVDQGDADNFLVEQLKSELLQTACNEAGQAVKIRMQPGYDHSYFFIATFAGDHVTHHAKLLK